MIVYVVEKVWIVVGDRIVFGVFSSERIADEYVAEKRAEDKALMMEGWEPSFCYEVSPVEVDAKPMRFKGATTGTSRS